jgi:hypothetical protein
VSCIAHALLCPFIRLRVVECSQRTYTSLGGGYTQTILYFLSREISTVTEKSQRSHAKSFRMKIFCSGTKEYSQRSHANIQNCFPFFHVYPLALRISAPCHMPWFLLLGWPWCLSYGGNPIAQLRACLALVHTQGHEGNGSQGASGVFGKHHTWYASLNFHLLSPILPSSKGSPSYGFWKANVGWLGTHWADTAPLGGCSIQTGLSWASRPSTSCWKGTVPQ